MPARRDRERQDGQRQHPSMNPECDGRAQDGGRGDADSDRHAEDQPLEGSVRVFGDRAHEGSADRSAQNEHCDPGREVRRVPGNEKASRGITGTNTEKRDRRG